jgi:zinc transport system substrate-binding protein
MKIYQSVLALVLFFTVALIATIFLNTTETDFDRNKIIVAASFYPLADFSQRVGGERVSVLTVTPAGADAHSFEPSAKVVSMIKNSDIFIYQGSGLDPWADRIASDVSKRNIVTMEMTSYFDLLEKEDEDDEHENDHEEEDDHDHDKDPHIWLDLRLAQKQVRLIADAFSAIDPKGANYYAMRAEQYISELEAIDQMYQEDLANCEIRTAIASHSAFSYLEKRYNIEIKTIAGLSPESEPSLKRLAELTKVARAHDIKHILYETLTSPAVAETLAREVNAKTLILNPIEGLTKEDEKLGRNYVSIMIDNLESLKTALRCQ